jgi:hypothetical protein
MATASNRMTSIPNYPVKLKRGAAQVSGCRDSYRITLNFNSYGITLNFNSASEGLLSSRRWWVRNDTGPALPVSLERLS